MVSNIVSLRTVIYQLIATATVTFSKWKNAATIPFPKQICKNILDTLVQIENEPKT